MISFFQFRNTVLCEDTKKTKLAIFTWFKNQMIELGLTTSPCTIKSRRY